MIIKTERSLTIYSGSETLMTEALGNGIRVRCVPAGEVAEYTIS